jgi:uncharacterized glyoxalase superfamily protein PhnB
VRIGGVKGARIVISGAHVILFSTDAEADRAFLRTLFPTSVDAGDGWSIFALPPAELAVHPTDAHPAAELYLMCDDVDATLADLATRGVEITRPVSEQRWGRLAAIRMPSGAELGLYQPLHPLARSDDPPSRA